METRGIILRGMETGGLRATRNSMKTGGPRPARNSMETRGPRPARKKRPPGFETKPGGLKRKTGGALLSHAPGRSTIAAGALNVRVREGNGCDSPAKATGQKRRHRKRRKNRTKAAEGAQGRARTARRAMKVLVLRPRPRRSGGMAGGGAGKPHGLSEPVC